MITICRAQPGCRVYVGNLSWEAAWQDLKDHMRGPNVSVSEVLSLQKETSACDFSLYCLNGF